MAYKIKIILTDEKGKDHIGEIVLSKISDTPKNYTYKIKKQRNFPEKKNSLDFSLNIYAFMKKINANRMSGPMKITALISYLGRGNAKNVIKAADVRKQWLKMKSILGKFNTFYYTPAKQNAWIDPVQPASYKVRKEGLEILRKA